MDRDPFGKPINRRQLLKSAALGVAAVQLAPRGLASAMAAQPLPDDVAVTEGTLTAAGEGWLEILLDNHEQRFSYTAGASFWKGGESLPGALALGDDVMVRTAVSSGRVLRVWSNLSRIGGQVIGRQQGGYVLRVNNHHAPPGDLLLELTAGTQFGNLATYGMGGPGGVLSEGDLVDAIGEQTPEGLRATLAYVARPDSASNTVTPRKDRGGIKTQVSPNCTNYTYVGYASWYDCPTNAGCCTNTAYRCDTSRDDQLAWPTLDSCCSGCCRYAQGCYDNLQLSCGSVLTVQDYCHNNRQITASIADCGPCQSASCTSCYPVLCNRTCGDCGGFMTAVLDLTKPTFARFYNPDAQGCFSGYFITPCV